MLDILQIHSFHGCLRYLDNAMNCAFFKFEENYPSSYLPRQNSQQFQLKIVQATSSKRITNISLSPKKIIFKTYFRQSLAREIQIQQHRTSIRSQKTFRIEHISIHRRKKKCFGKSSRRSEVSIDSRINGGRVSKRDAKSKCHVRR